MQMNQRMVMLTYFQGEVRFDTQAEQDEFHKAMGRMVMAMLAQPGPEACEFVEVFIQSKSSELLGVFHPPVGLDNEASTQLQAALLQQKQARVRLPKPFVMGSVKHGPGEPWTFHS